MSAVKHLAAPREPQVKKSMLLRLIYSPQDSNPYTEGGHMMQLALDRLPLEPCRLNL